MVHAYAYVRTRLFSLKKTMQTPTFPSNRTSLNGRSRSMLSPTLPRSVTDRLLESSPNGRGSYCLSPRVEASLAYLGGVTPRQQGRVRKVDTLSGYLSNTAPPVLARLKDGLEYGTLHAADTTEEELNQNQGVATVCQSILNGINILLGVGVLSLPYALKVSGWAVGMGLLVLFSLATNYTGKLIGRMMMLSGNIRSFPDMGFAAFGKVGQRLVSWVFFVELFSACGMYLILCGDNLHALLNSTWPGVSKTELTLIGAAVMAPTALTSRLSLLSYFSVVGTLSSCFLALSIVAIGALNKNLESGTFLHPAQTEVVTDAHRAPLAIGLVMVGFAGHACFPSVRCSMAKPSRYNRMLDVSYGVCFLVYAGVAILGYMMYGHDTKEEITLNIVSTKGASHLVRSLATAATVLIVINPITKFGLTMNPVSLMVEEFLLPNLEHSDEFDSNTTTRPGKKCQHLLSIMIRLVLSSLCVGAAIAVPNFAKVVSFIGAFCSCFVSIVFPVAAYMRLQWNEISLYERFLCAFLLVIGCVGSIWGTIAVFIAS